MEMLQMTELSPAAKAVLDASKSVYWRPVIDVPYCQSRVVAAALRAASGYFFPSDTAQQCYDRLNALAAELEAH